MVTTALHQEAMDTANERLDLQSIRRPHLSDLIPLEAIVREHCPLPVTYDVSKTQPPYFNEFTYGECLGGLMLAPQSCEIAARMTELAVNDDAGHRQFDPLPVILERLATTSTLDKYQLNPVSRPEVTDVAFVPGTNLFRDIVSREALTRAMFENDALIIKLHPLTHDQHIRELAGEFGYHRLIDPQESGWAYLSQATRIYATSTTEMGLYASLFNKPVHNISQFMKEHTGAFHQFFRHIGPDPSTSTERLLRVLRSPFSGVFFPQDPNVEERISIYLRTVMEVRQAFKPLVYEMSPRQWASVKSIPQEQPR